MENNQSNKIIEAIKNDPNVAEDFSRQFCECGGIMFSRYDHFTNSLIMTCVNCGKEKTFTLSNKEN